MYQLAELYRAHLAKPIVSAALFFVVLAMLCVSWTDHRPLSVSQSLGISYPAAQKPMTPQTAGREVLSRPGFGRFSPMSLSAGKRHLVKNACRRRTTKSNLIPKSSRSASITAQTFKVSEATMLQVEEDDAKPLDAYLKEVERIVELSFRDSNRRKRLDDNTWEVGNEESFPNLSAENVFSQVQLLSQNLVGIKFQPVTKLKVYSDEEGLHISVSDMNMDLPPSLAIAVPPVLEVFGTMKPSVRLPRGKTILRGSVDMAFTADIPPQIMMVPGASNLVKALLRGILMQLKASLENGIPEDYRRWCEE